MRLAPGASCSTCATRAPPRSPATPRSTTSSRSWGCSTASSTRTPRRALGAVLAGAWPTRRGLPLPLAPSPHPLDFASPAATHLRAHIAMPQSLRYGHLMIMTDQDHDGSHIKGLIMNFFHHFYPSLLRMPGFLVEFITPIIKVRRVPSTRVPACSLARRAPPRSRPPLPAWLLARPGHQGQGVHLLLHPARVRGVEGGAQPAGVDDQVLQGSGYLHQPGGQKVLCRHCAAPQALCVAG